MNFVTKSASQTMTLGMRIACHLKPGDVIAMTGTLGAGKTTITQGIAKALNITQTVTSPTFTLISEYQGTLPLYHMDAYRLSGTQDFEDIGALDLLYGDGVCVVEWSDIVKDALPQRTITLDFSVLPDGSRNINISNWPYETLTLPQE